MLIRDILARQRSNDSLAIVEPGRSISYRRLHQQAADLARLLPCPGARSPVGLLLPNGVDYVCAYFAAAYADRVILPFHASTPAIELTEVIEFAGVDTLITDSRIRGDLGDTLATGRHFLTVIDMADGSRRTVGGAAQLIGHSDPESFGPADDPSSVALLLHTSGTSSIPKRVMLTHENLVSNLTAHIAAMDFSAAERTLISLPMAFGYCNTAQLLAHLYLGASIVVAPGPFLPARISRVIADFQPSNYTAVPTNLVMLSQYRKLARHNLTSLRTVCFGGGHMPSDTLLRLAKQLPHVNFANTYGQTEAGPRITAQRDAQLPENHGSVGPTLPGVTLKVVDDAGREVPDGRSGKILVRSPSVMRGYLSQPELTAATLRDGWLHTGDIGVREDHGRTRITGRLKNMLICGGVNVFPEQIEAVLAQDPAVEAVLVKAEDHPVLGEVPVAYVVPRGGLSVDPRKLSELCQDHLGPTRIPRRVEMVESLPRTLTGKVYRGANRPLGAAEP